jgi:excisionase family DNA binding protein
MAMKQVEEELLTTAEAARLLRLSISTLERMRAQGDSGLRFIKLGRGKRAKVGYSRREVLEWLEAQKFNSTSEYPRDDE